MFSILALKMFEELTYFVIYIYIRGFHELKQMHQIFIDNKLEAFYFFSFALQHIDESPLI